MAGWYAYLLRCADGTLYAGSTTDVARRLAEHNGSPKGAAYTRSRRPVALAYVRAFATRSQASAYEAELKSLTRAQKLALIAAEES